MLKASHRPKAQNKQHPTPPQLERQWDVARYCMPHVSPGPTCAAISEMVHGNPCFLMLCLYSVGFMFIGLSYIHMWIRIRKNKSQQSAIPSWESDRKLWRMIPNGAALSRAMHRFFIGFTLRYSNMACWKIDHRSRWFSYSFLNLHL